MLSIETITPFLGEINEWIEERSKEKWVYQSIPGQFNSEDVWGFVAENMFCELKSEVTLGVHKGPLRIVEVGAYLGQSTSFIIELITRSYMHEFTQRPIELHVVDTFEGASAAEVATASSSGGSFFEQFTKNLGPWYKHGLIDVHVGKSLDVVNKFEDNSIDFVFIDADHEEEEVHKDLQAWYPKVRHEGGVIGGHDWHDSGVRAAYGRAFWRPPTIIANNSWLLCRTADGDIDPRGAEFNRETSGHPLDPRYISEMGWEGLTDRVVWSSWIWIWDPARWGQYRPPPKQG